MSGSKHPHVNPRNPQIVPAQEKATMKRCFDIAIALAALTLLLPILPLLALWVRLDTPGPVIYAAKRIGCGGRPFTMYKFRTMVADAARGGPPLTTGDDPRITRAGRFLRRTHLDELPQLLNVLRGEMSLVGPRPEAPEYVDAADPIWQQVLAVRPGICGPSQLVFATVEREALRSHATAAADYTRDILPAKLAIDLQYAQSASLAGDLVVIARTTLHVLAEAGAGAGAWLGRMGLPAALRHGLPLVLLDALGVLLAFWAALLFRFDGSVPPESARAITQAMPLILASFVAGNHLSRLYHALWRYTGSREVVRIAAATAASTLALVVILSLIWGGARPVPISVVVLGGVLAGAVFVAVRYRRRLITGLIGYLERTVGSPNRTRVLIVGAGRAAQFVAQQIEELPARQQIELVGFVDDDPAKHGLLMRSATVLGDRNAIPRLVSERGVGLIVVAIHNISGRALRELLAVCLSTSAKIKLLPDFLGSLDQNRGVLPLRDISPEDLLGRLPCAVDEAACRALIAGKSVLVTGAAGSIGSELCRQLLALGPSRLLLLDNNETGVYDLQLALGDDPRLVPVVADVTVPPAVAAIFRQHHPQVVFHAAAYKHVPMMERYPREAARVNILGTRTVLDLCERHGVERFVLISTDKAVHPSSVMGATKRLCELMVLSRSARGGTRRTLLTAVRFGNVLGSRGSVVPTFTYQIAHGGPVTVTHREMTRYFLSIAEAVSLTVQAATLTVGGDLFMLDMGEPLRIQELAVKMIRLRGLRPEVDIPIRYTGIRPGEKLHEELLAPDETCIATPHPQIARIASESPLTATDLDAAIDDLLADLFDATPEELAQALRRLARTPAALQSAEALG
jgi:FlaA1/EpsC-like NDP-sugar epimerase/lipopolysaccharide/colanic/teichoic acid biosynthesis glycosyltransferase